MKRLGILLGLVLIATLAAPASAHRDVKITICIPYYKGAECAKGKATPSYVYGDDVVVKGRVSPLHSGTVKVQRTQRQRPWRTVARVPLEDGRYRYVWRTTRDDADQGTPYKFRAVLPNHDRSRVQKVYVLYGE